MMSAYKYIGQVCRKIEFPEKETIRRGFLNERTRTKWNTYSIQQLFSRKKLTISLKAFYCDKFELKKLCMWKLSHSLNHRMYSFYSKCNTTLHSISFINCFYFSDPYRVLIISVLLKYPSHDNLYIPWLSWYLHSLLAFAGLVYSVSSHFLNLIRLQEKFFYSCLFAN